MEQQRLKRITFVGTKELEEEMDILKKWLFYNSSRSSMIRKLIALGICAAKEEKEAGCSISSKRKKK